ncbi:heme-binding domain-containing protein [Flavisolibacter sp. BT320]|nr:heme-binding domain-containing protein [Flavisolibacter longurius]
MKRKRWEKILLGIVIVFVLIQFIRPQKNNGVAETDKDFTHFLFVPDTVRSLLRTSCYDCHSNKTVYPWYAEIAPASWWLANHIKEGKAELNFSDFSQYSSRRLKTKLNGIGEQVATREMPLKSYLLIHGNAEFSDGQIKIIKDWTDSAKAELQIKNQQ